MSKRWAVEIAEAIKAAGNGSSGEGLMLMKINSVQPVTLISHDQELSRHIYINPIYSPHSGDDVLVYQSGVSFYILMKVVPV